MADIKILFTGGGSGGHVYPLLAVHEELKRIAKEQALELEVDYMGPEDEYAEILRTASIRIIPITSGKLRRYVSFSNFTDVPKFFIGVIEALFKVYRLMPDVIFSKGGTGALPVVVAGWFYRIPIIIHESDVIPGLTNATSARFAARIAVSFERALEHFNQKKAAWVGSSVRRELLEDRPSAVDAKTELGFDPKSPLILILGGSLGSARINEFIVANLPGILKETQVLHQTGQANYEEVEKLSRAALTDPSLQAAGKGRYRAMAYLDIVNLKTALSAADLVIARAGSGTIFEMAAFGKPAILIPLKESANDHQRANAYEFAAGGAAVVIEEPNLLGGIFLMQLQAILKNPEKLKRMSAASQNFFKPGAAQAIAEEILRLAE